MATKSSKRTPRWNRWAQLVQTSPSGKALFVCLVCGEVTPAPNNQCRRFDERSDRDGRRSLDPRVLQAFPDIRNCSDIESYINAEIEKNIADELVLVWVENELREFSTRNCSVCHGYGCQACVGKGRRW